MIDVNVISVAKNKPTLKTQQKNIDVAAKINSKKIIIAIDWKTLVINLSPIA